MSKDIFRIDKQHILYEIAEHSRRIATYTQLLEELNVKRKRSEAVYERIKSKTYIKYREKLIDDNPKLMSEKYLDAKVVTHKKVKEARANLIEAERKYEETKGIVKALHSKTEMLKEFAYTVRGELKKGIERSAVNKRKKRS